MENHILKLKIKIGKMSLKYLFLLTALTCLGFIYSFKIGCPLHNYKLKPTQKALKIRQFDVGADYISKNKPFIETSWLGSSIIHNEGNQHILFGDPRDREKMKKQKEKEKDKKKKPIVEEKKEPVKETKKAETKTKK